MSIAGIDPGLSGAIALFEAGKVSIWDMPTVFSGRGGKSTARDLDIHTFCGLLDWASVSHAFIEQAQGMPKQSAYATGIFFQSYGMLLGALAAMKVPYTIVHPRTWKKALSVPKEKDAARGRASQLMPGGAGSWPLKKHDGRAEAALLAYYGNTRAI